jgi:hypothetical protein
VIDFVVSRNNRGFTESLYHWFIQTSVIFESEVLRFYLLFVAFFTSHMKCFRSVLRSYDILQTLSETYRGIEILCR